MPEYEKYLNKLLRTYDDYVMLNTVIKNCENKYLIDYLGMFVLAQRVKMGRKLCTEIKQDLA